MNPTKERKLIEAVLDEYRAWLDGVPEEQFIETPPGGGWSYAEVYSHILQASLASAMALDRCAQRTGSSNTKGLNLLGHLVFSFGRFPPVRITVPEKVAAKMPVSKISKEEAKNLIIKCRARMESVLPQIKEADINSRVKHPRLGLLNAAQWFKFIRIHLQHHLKQLKRIEKKFSNA